MNNKWYFVIGGTDSGKTDFLMNQIVKLQKHGETVYGYSPNITDVHSERSTTVFSTTETLHNRNALLKNIENDAINRWYFITDKCVQYFALKSLLIDLMPSITGIVVSKSTYKVSYVHKQKGRILGKSLCDSYKKILAVVGDIVLNLKADFDGNPYVLIDDFDLLIPRDLQNNFIEVMSNTFKNMKFVCTCRELPYTDRNDIRIDFVCNDITL